MGGVWRPQSPGASVGLIDSHDEITDAPNSDAYVPGHAAPVSAGLAICGGTLSEKGSRLPEPELTVL